MPDSARLLADRRLTPCVAGRGKCGFCNAVARLAGLIATAALPLAAGIGGSAKLEGAAYTAGYTRAMFISAGLCAAGAVVALVTVRNEGGERAGKARGH